MLTKLSQSRLKKIRESHKFCCIEIHSDFDYVWHIILTKYESYNHDSKIKTLCYEDLNDAVKEIYLKVKNEKS